MLLGIDGFGSDLDPTVPLKTLARSPRSDRGIIEP
jgi:hypothetical protein